MTDEWTNAQQSGRGTGPISVDTSTEGVAIYTYAGGRRLRVKANVPVRYNNPGCLIYGTAPACFGGCVKICH